jgi:hypothetical protein
MRHSNASRRRSRGVAGELDVLFRSTYGQTLEAALDKCGSALERASAQAGTKWERTEVARRVAELKLRLVCRKSDSWSEVRKAHTEIERLGFSDTERRVLNAANVARWCADHHEHAGDAARLLEEARRSVIRLPRRSRLRSSLGRQVSQFLTLLARPGP